MLHKLPRSSFRRSTVQGTPEVSVETKKLRHSLRQLTEFREHCAVQKFSMVETCGNTAKLKWTLFVDKQKRISIFWMSLASTVWCTLDWPACCCLIAVFWAGTLLGSVDFKHLSLVFFGCNVAPNTSNRRDPVENYYAPVIPFYFLCFCHWVASR